MILMCTYNINIQVKYIKNINILKASVFLWLSGKSTALAAQRLWVRVRGNTCTDKKMYNLNALWIKAFAKCKCKAAVSLASLSPPLLKTWYCSQVWHYLYCVGFSTDESHVLK